MEYGTEVYRMLNQIMRIGTKPEMNPVNKNFKSHHRLQIIHLIGEHL